ncbi:MAG: hypothetical protein ACJAWV_002328 [Flammeovirgaceae bacterium]|jgi:hypothetical protein
MLIAKCNNVAKIENIFLIAMEGMYFQKNN